MDFIDGSGVRDREDPKSIRKFIVFFFIGVFIAAVSCLLLAGMLSNVHAYTVVTTSTGAPAGLEDSFIAQTTTQFNASLYVNPLFAGTYQIQLFGVNPSYNPPLTNVDLENMIVTISSWSYPYGWADGMRYERGTDLQYMSNFLTDCVNDSTSTFNMNIDTTTCVAAISAVQNFIYQLDFSTPTAVPGDFQ